MVGRIWNHLTLRARSDSGIGMILVIGIVIFVAGITATAGVIAMNGLGQSRHRISFEQALAAAESGIDHALGQLQYTYDTQFADYPIPMSGTAPTATCTASDVQMPTDSNDPAAWNEQAWAEGQLDALESGPLGGDSRPRCLLKTPMGEVLILKPRNATGGPGLKYGRVYARGWAPAWGHPRAVERTLKVEYVFMPFSPKHAVLTGANLTLQGSYLVDEANGVIPATAGVHTNGDLSVVGGGGDVSGPVSYLGSASGTTTFSGGAATKASAEIRIPTVSARQLYTQAASNPAAIDPSKWRDLCPDGTVKEYDTVSHTPCEGPPHGGGTGNWSFDGSGAVPLWTANRDTFSGTYFVHMADAENGTGNPDFDSITVIASASTPASKGNCPSPRWGGNIIWDHYAVGVPSYSDLWFLADQDLIVHANFDAGSNGENPVAGTYIAGEEIELFTSSSMLVGSVLAANQCDNDSGPLTSDTNKIQGQEIWFKPNADSPFSSIVSTTLWLEY